MFNILKSLTSFTEEAVAVAADDVNDDEKKKGSSTSSVGSENKKVDSSAAAKRRSSSDRSYSSSSSSSASASSSSSEESVLSKDQYFGEEDEEIGDYYLIRYIGSGSFGVVWRASKKEDDDAIVALKISRKDELSDREVRMLKLVGEHPNIVTLFQSFEFDGGRRIVLAMNLMKTTLFDYRRTFEDKILPPDEARETSRQLLEAARHLEEVNIVHTDIKPENILVDHHEDGSVWIQLADFGSASNVNGNDLCRYGKTPAYRAPEILCNSHRCIRPPADVWSVACCIFENYSGTVLFDPYQSNAYSARSTDSDQTSHEMNKQQLALMVELLGKFPRRFAMENREYFNRLGELKDVGGPITKIDMRAILVVECGLEESHAHALYEFIMPMLLYTPRLRAKPADLLSHSFLQPAGASGEKDADFHGE
jgi:serine/threonine protein kinase